MDGPEAFLGVDFVPTNKILPKANEGDSARVYISIAS